MKTIRNLVGLAIIVALIFGAWVFRYHSAWLRPAPEEEKEDEIASEVPVKTAKIIKATLRRYVEGFGTVDPEPARAGRQPASAAVASPVTGSVAAILCEPGQRVGREAPLVQLDDRLAKAAEEQAAAALASARATLAKLKATPRPEQLDVARLTADKARMAAGFAERNYERQKQLAPEQVTSEKSLQAAEQELAAARSDLRIAELQLALLKASPAPEELAEAAAKVNEAEKALAVARTQRALLTIRSPLDATVVRIAANPGDAVDATRVLIELVALDRLVVDAAVPAEDLLSLATGLRAEVVMAARPGGTAFATAATQPASRPSEASASCEVVQEGTTCFIAPQIDRKTNSVLVVVSLPADTRMRPGQYVRVRIVVEERAGRLAVPVESVVDDEEGNTVVAIVHDDRAQRTPVKPGLRDGGLMEIEGEDLHEGDTVVTAGAYGLPKQSRIRRIEQ